MSGFKEMGFLKPILIILNEVEFKIIVLTPFPAL